MSLSRQIPSVYISDKEYVTVCFCRGELFSVYVRVCLGDIKKPQYDLCLCTGCVKIPNSPVRFFRCGFWKFNQ